MRRKIIFLLVVLLLAVVVFIAIRKFSGSGAPPRQPKEQMASTPAPPADDSSQGGTPVPPPGSTPTVSTEVPPAVEDELTRSVNAKKQAWERIASGKDTPMPATGSPEPPWMAEVRGGKAPMFRASQLCTLKAQHERVRDFVASVTPAEEALLKKPATEGSGKGDVTNFLTEARRRKYQLAKNLAAGTMKALRETPEATADCVVGQPLNHSLVGILDYVLLVMAAEGIRPESVATTPAEIRDWLIAQLKREAEVFKAGPDLPPPAFARALNVMAQKYTIPLSMLGLTPDQIIQIQSAAADNH